MVDEIAIGSFLTASEYDLIKNEMGISSFDQVTTDEMCYTTGLDPIIGIIPEDETTLNVDEYKYMTDSTNFVHSTPSMPPEEPKELCTVDYAGPFSFEVFVDPNVMKNPWEYSPTLNKIYIDMKHKFPINFSVKERPQIPLFIRVIPMFEEDRHFQELVHRCLCHELPHDPMNKGLDARVIQHIIRVDNKDAMYCGDKKAERRLSIVIPLGRPQAGTDSVKEFFSFVCKNSCVGGMARRPIQVIFTLEDVTGNVHGRRVLCVRICSCPKRDREKEEKKNDKEKQPTGKKRKLEKGVSSPVPHDTTDVTVYSVNLNIMGKENYKQTMQYVQMLMGNGMSETKNQAITAMYKKYKDEAANLLNQIPE